MSDWELYRAQDHAWFRGLCGDISSFRHLCTRWADHGGRHNGVLVDNPDDSAHVAHAWD